MDFERNRKPFREINLTALIDIVFHLMVFVMLTTSFVVVESMELSLPSGKEQAASTAGVMPLKILSDGAVMVDGNALTLERLSTALAERIAANVDTHVAIYTTPGVSVQQLVSVLDAVYFSGARNVQVDRVL